jgi:hypothetical protein
MVKTRMLIAMATAVATATLSGSAAASPIGNQSPNQEEAFPVTCNGIAYVLIDVPRSADHADFTPAFVTTSRKVIIPFAFDVTQTVTLLSEEAVFDGTTYHAGDVLFSGSESTSIGARRPADATCTFGGSGTETFQDDNGNDVEIGFEFSGTATVLMPGKR